VRTLSMLLLLFPLVAPATAHAGLFNRNKGDEEAPPEGDFPPFEEVIDGHDAIEGLFDFYRDPDTGVVLWAVGEDQWDTDYMMSLKMDGSVGERGLYGTIMMDAFVFQLRRQGNQVQVVQRNLTFRADEGTPEERALDKSFSDSVITAATVASMPAVEGGAVLVDLGALFAQQDIVGFAKVLGQRYQGGYGLDGDNSLVTDVKSFPANSELQVTTRFVGDSEDWSVVVPDLKALTVSFHYSLLQLPDDGYVPRVADQRVGYFLQRHLNYSDTGPDVPRERWLSRWHLEKQDPAAPVSDPVEPIVFWLENTVPERYRAAMTEGVLFWNAAFEQAGISNAIVVKQQPDDADWDPADVRYNTIRWFLTYDASFAIGPSHHDPRTGQILDADIGFSDGLIRFGAIAGHNYWVDPVSGVQDLIRSATRPGTAHCTLASEKAMAAGFAYDLVGATRGWSSEEEQEYVRQYVAEVSAHEVGHTLGLRHNFLASGRYDMETLLDWTEDHLATATSVMDYNPPVIAPEGQSQGPYLPMAVGSYDRHAVEYGYRVFADADAEAAGLQALAAKGALPDYAFSTDEDAGFWGAHLDPRVSRYDYSSEPLAWFAYNISLVDRLWENLGELAVQGGDYNAVRSGFDRTWRNYVLGGLVAAKHIGGLYQDRSHVGDEGGALPFTPVSAADQRAALDFLADEIWAPGTFDLPADLQAMLQMDQLGDLEWSRFTAYRQDYPLHEVVAQVQGAPLAMLFDPARLSRMVDVSVMTDDTLSIDELFSTLRKTIWSELSLRGPIDSHRRTLQQSHVDHLVATALHQNPGAPADAVSLARLELTELQRLCKRAAPRMSERTSRAHLERLAAEIGQVLDATVEWEREQAPPM